MPSKTDIEMRWVNAWNDLSDIVRDRRDVPCQLPDYTIVSVEDCKGWLQDSAYDGYEVAVQAGWVGHKLGVLATRFKADAPKS